MTYKDVLKSKVGQKSTLKFSELHSIRIALNYIQLSVNQCSFLKYATVYFFFKKGNWFILKIWVRLGSDGAADRV